MDRRELIELVNGYNQEYKLLESGDRVVTGISGGPDSVCLFLVLQELRKEMGFEMEVVHVNHGLRSEAAEADEQFVRQLCRKWEVPCHVFREDVRRRARDEKLSMEEAGRETRKDCFEAVLKQCKGTKIALAHHMDDNAETLLMNLSRGSGLRGLGGMRPRNGNIIRPLLCLRRREIEAFLRQEQQAWCEDESNKEDHYTRNRIRNHVLPYLEAEVNSATVEHMNAAMEQMRELEEYLEEETERAYQEYVSVFPNSEDASETRELLLSNRTKTIIPKVIRSRLILKCMSRVSGREQDISAQHVAQVEGLLEKQTGKRLSLPHGVQAFREYEGIRFLCAREDMKSLAAEKEKKELPMVLNLAGDTRCTHAGCIFRTKIVKNSENMSKACPYTEWFNYDIIKMVCHDREREESDLRSAVVIRHRQAGDYMVIDRAGHRKKLKTLFVDRKIPANRRDQIPVLALGDEILWVPGVRRSSAYLITEETRQILQIEYTEDK